MAQSSSGGKMPKSEEGELSSSPTQIENKPPSSFHRSPFKATTSVADTQFPRYPTTRTYSIPQRRRKHYSTAPITTLIANGPDPAKGTPQDRFRQAVLGIGEISQPAATMSQAPFGPSPTPTAPCAAPSAGGFWGGYPSGAATKPSDVGYGRLVPPAALGGGAAPAPAPWTIDPLWGRAPHVNVVHEQPRAPQDVPQPRRPDTSHDHQAPTALLSLECQARRFNPEFIESVTRDGRFMCSVRLKSEEISSSRTFDTPNEARYAIAKRGLKIVRGWPKPTPTELKRLRAAAEADRMHNKNAQLSQLDEQLRKITKERDSLRSGNGRKSATTVKSETGSAASAPSSVNMDNPIEARAFLEGFELGRRLAVAEEKRDRERENRRRSRSPVRELDRDISALPSYRRRSHSRDRHRIERAVSVPHGYYRGEGRDRTPPHTDRYRPRSSEGHGRKRTKRSLSEEDGGRSPEKY